MRIYISGPFSGVERAYENFSRAEYTLSKCKDVKVVNPIKINNGMDFSYDEFMIFDLMLLSMCDAVYMLRGWRESDGARMELIQAIMDKKLIFFEEFHDEECL